MHREVREWRNDSESVRRSRRRQRCCEDAEMIYGRYEDLWTTEKKEQNRADIQVNQQVLLKE